MSEETGETLVEKSGRLTLYDFEEERVELKAKWSFIG